MSTIHKTATGKWVMKMSKKEAKQVLADGGWKKTAMPSTRSSPTKIASKIYPEPDLPDLIACGDKLMPLIKPKMLDLIHFLPLVADNKPDAEIAIEKFLAMVGAYDAVTDKALVRKWMLITLPTLNVFFRQSKIINKETSDKFYTWFETMFPAEASHNTEMITDPELRADIMGINKPEMSEAERQQQIDAVLDDKSLTTEQRDNRLRELSARFVVQTIIRMAAKSKLFNKVN